MTDLEPLIDVIDVRVLARYVVELKFADAEAGTIVWPNGADISPRTLYAESKPTIPARTA